MNHPTQAQQRVERAALIAKLGWQPEPPIASERYCATTGELWQSVAERFGIDAANHIRDAARAPCIDCDSPLHSTGSPYCNVANQDESSES